MYHIQPLDYAVSLLRSLCTSLSSHSHSPKIPNHLFDEDQFWLSAWGSSNGARLLLVLEGNLVHVTMLLIQCSLLLLVLTTMLVLFIAVYKQGVQTLLKVVQICKQFLLAWVYRPQLCASFSISRLTTCLKQCIARITDLQSRLQKVLPCPVCLCNLYQENTV